MPKDVAKERRKVLLESQEKPAKRRWNKPRLEKLARDNVSPETLAMMEEGKKTNVENE